MESKDFFQYLGVEITEHLKFTAERIKRAVNGSTSEGGFVNKLVNSNSMIDFKNAHAVADTENQFNFQVLKSWLLYLRLETAKKIEDFGYAYHQAQYHNYKIFEYYKKNHSFDEKWELNDIVDFLLIIKKISL